MEVDFMELQVLYRNRFLLFLFTAFVACNAPGKKTAHTPLLLLNKNEQRLVMQNGLVLYNQQPFSGTLYTLFPNTTDTAELAAYINGKEHAEWKRFYASGKLKEKRYFELGKKTGLYQSFWENGIKQMQYFFVNDEYEGICYEWNESGRLTRLMNYKRGHENGLQQSWYDNGKTKANYIIKAGRRYGLLGTKNCMNVSDSIFKL
jgi:antitoxin component YwqK of YwqJK toxin-antitoxin module